MAPPASSRNSTMKRTTQSRRSSLRRSKASSERNMRIKRTVERQRSSPTDFTATELISNTIVGSLSDLAQTFLFPKELFPEEDPDEPQMRATTPKQKNLSTTTSTQAEGNGEETAESSVPLLSRSGRSSVDTQTPPPNLVESPISTSSLASTIHRPIPVGSPIPSSPRSGFEPVKPLLSDSGAARISRSDDSQNNKDAVAEKYRKWKREIQKHRRQRQPEEDDTSSVLTVCGPIGTAGHKPVEVLKQLIRAPCAHVEDVIFQDEQVDDYDTCVGSEDSIASVVEEEEEEEEEHHLGRRHKVALKAPSESPPLSVQATTSIEDDDRSEVSGIKDKNFIKAFIAEMSQGGMMLIWHGPEEDSSAFKRPCGVISYLNFGSPRRDDGVYVGPQLVWKKQDGTDGGAIDLFDIRSLDTASLEMLNRYQFAIPGNSFFVVLSNGRHLVFEASSEAETRRFIHGLRWVVARLSFNLVVGNPLVSCELLDVAHNGNTSSKTPMEEALWSKAMNDVTNHLVDKSVSPNMARNELVCE